MKRQPVLSEEMPAFIGIDYHKAYSVYSVLDLQGDSLGQCRIDHAHPEDFRALVRRWPGCRVVFEAGMNWHWLFEILERELSGLEKVNVSVELAKDGRRPLLALEASNIRTGSGRRGSCVDMCSKEKPVNLGSPPWREERSRPEIREEQAGLRRVAERSVVAMKRVMIVERRDLSSRATLRYKRG